MIDTYISEYISLNTCYDFGDVLKLREVVMVVVGGWEGVNKISQIIYIDKCKSDTKNC